MKNLPRELEIYRTAYLNELGDLRNGRVVGVPLKSGARACIVFSDGGNWDHVSVTVDAPRCPTWEEMCEVKDIFWWPADCVVQYHPPQSQYRNHHPYCLHLWRPQKKEIPLPPAIFVAPPTAEKVK